MSSFSSRIREAEHQSISACRFHKIQVCADLNSPMGKWSLVKPDDSMMDGGADTNTNTILDGIGLEEGTTVRIVPMDRKCGGWDKEHFQTDLTPPTNANSFLLTFEATARECIAIALSPEPDYSLGKTYAVHIGAGGNLTTVIRRWLPSGEECVEASFSTIRICADFVFKGYWILFQDGKLYVGTGKIPGRQCVAMLDDSLYDQLRPGQDKVRYIGLGNSSLHRHARDLKIRKIKLTTVPETLDLSTLHPDPTFNLSGHPPSSSSSETQKYDRELLQQYHEECAKAQSRAIKYNTPIDSEPPGPDAFLKWSEARRLRANPEPGFITGIDVTSEAEALKRKRRKERFERDERMRKLQSGETMDTSLEGNEESRMNEEGDENNNDNDENNNESDYMNNEANNNKVLPVEQAWDNIDFIREYRMDPLTDEMDVQPVPEKLHLFAIDWAAFKQMRSDDIMAYFSIYGPSYVEWLSELSCNVMFQDKFSAIRAMQALSQELPSPPPTFENDVENNDSSIEQLPTTTDTATDNIDTDNNMTTTETENETKDANENPPNDESQQPEQQQQQQQPSPPLEDLGAMGWRFGNSLLRKISNDRFGRRGTRSRFLIRVATTMDILEQKPTHSPAPPPGFTTKRILGPGSDFPSKRRRRKGNNKRDRGNGRDRNRDRGDRDRDRNRDGDRGGGEGGQRRAKRRRRNEDVDMEQLLNQGLSARR